MEGEDIRDELSRGVQRASDESERGGPEAAAALFSDGCALVGTHCGAASGVAKILEIDVSVAR